MVNNHGWKSIQWGITSALIIGLFGAAVAGWRSFTLLQERMEYLLRLNDQQNQLFDVIKDSIKDLQKQVAMNTQTDDAQRDRLIEHDTYLRHILERLRKVEQDHPGVRTDPER